MKKDKRKNQPNSWFFLFKAYGTVAAILKQRLILTHYEKTKKLPNGKLFCFVFILKGAVVFFMQNCGRDFVYCVNAEGY